MAKGPDPSEFDPEFVIGEEDEQPGRAATPRPKEKAQPTDPAAGSGNANDNEDKAAGDADKKPDAEPELPPEVHTRLRKLDKLEPKYSGRQEHPESGEPG